MELYIEKNFLDLFSKEFNQNNLTIGQLTLSKIFKEYPDVKWFINCDINTQEQILMLKLENQFFAPVSESSPPTGIDSIKDHFFEKSKCGQTLIFTINEEDWFDEAERKGALCFSYDNYQEKIKEIIDKCHFKIDLSERFKGWEETLKSIQELLPLNKIIINDSYLLDKPEFYETNVYPLIKGISKNRKTTKHFYTDIVNSSKKRTPPDKLKIYYLLKEKYKSSEIVVVHNNVDNLGNHDRLLYSNHYIIDCAIGFNFNPRVVSNSQIIVETIFEKYTYNRLRNHLRAMVKHIHSLETEKRFNLYYPQ